MLNNVRFKKNRGCDAVRYKPNVFSHSLTLDLKMRNGPKRGMRYKPEVRVSPWEYSACWIYPFLPHKQSQWYQQISSVTQNMWDRLEYWLFQNFTGLLVFKICFVIQCELCSAFSQICKFCILPAFCHTSIGQDVMLNPWVSESLNLYSTASFHISRWV